MRSLDFGLFINGEWVEKEGAIEIFNPYNNERIGSVSRADNSDIDSAIHFAKEAYRRFKDTSLYERAQYLKRIAGKLSEKKDILAKTISLESGKAIRFSTGEVQRAIETFDFAADEAKKLSGEMVPLEAAKGGIGRIGFYLKVPIGVVLAITPYNFPLNLAAHKIAPAIAAGDTVIWKPSTYTPLTAGICAEIFKEVDLPPGVVNVVFGPGKEVGERLVESDELRLVSFTGSLDVGKRLKKLAGVKKTLLELGSNSALVIDEGVENLKEVADRAIIGAFANAGQVCISVQRIYLHSSLFDEFVTLFVQAAREINIGDPLSPDVLYGPMISEKEARRAEEWIAEALNMGARPLLLGTREGTTLSPTILTDVNFDMKVVSNEVFAPVVSIMPFDSFEQALDMVNHSDYGLNAGIYTPYISNMLKAIKECEVGSIVINDYPTFRVDNMPYGGVKMSGIGREGPPFAIDEYTEIRFVAVRG